MTEEKKEVYELKKESVKQFLIIVGGSFLGCILAILLMGQVLKPKFHHCPHCHFMPPVHAQMYHNHHKHCWKLDRIGDRKMPPFAKAPERKFNKDFQSQVKKAVEAPVKQ